MSFTSLVEEVVRRGWLPPGFPLDSGEVVVDVVCGLRATRGYTVFLLYPWGRYGIKYSPINKCAVTPDQRKVINNLLRWNTAIALIEAGGGYPCPNEPVPLMAYKTTMGTLIPWGKILSVNADVVGRDYAVLRLGGRGTGCSGVMVLLDRSRGGKEFYEAMMG